MAIRKMKIDDVEAVSRVAVSAFMDSVADGLSKEGIATFLSLSAPESFAAHMNEDIHMLVCEINDELIGMVELKEGRHVAMLFVVPAAQKRGIGRALVEKALRQSRVSTITVSASVPSVSAYESFGFKVVGPEAEKQGLIYVPMEIELNK